jgi:predicted Zn-dependent protease
MLADRNRRRGEVARCTAGVVSSAMRLASRCFAAGDDRAVSERQGPASSPYDEEGVATVERAVVRDGVLEGYS